MTDAYLTVTRLYKAWPDARIDISFSAPKDSMTCIVGPSGCGKTTVLRMMAGLTRLDPHPDGRTAITVGGREITALPPGRRNCGLVFQDASLFLHMTVQDNVAYGLRCEGLPTKEARALARDFLRQFQMESFAKRYPESLSGGEAQRVALARTLIVKPRLVLLDEPLSALDAPLRKKLAQEIRMLQQKNGFTAVMVTHDIDEAKAIGDSIILMDKGRKIWQGAPEDFSERLMPRQAASEAHA